MEGFDVTITSQNESYDYSNISYNYNDSSNIINNNYHNPYVIISVGPCIIAGIGLPLTLVAIYALCSQIQKDHVAPIYIINLLISDLIQFGCLIIWRTPTARVVIKRIFTIIYLSALVVSVGFMVCIALERYLVIAHPLWYRFRQTIKISVGVCVLVWIVPLVCVPIFFFWVNGGTGSIILGIFFFLPLPLFIFFLGGTLKALSASRVPSDEKRRIVGILVLVLLIYMLLFLPEIILLLSQGDLFSFTLSILSSIFLRLSPLANLTLYVFMRKGIIDKLLSSVCCCRMDSDTNSPSV